MAPRSASRLVSKRKVSRSRKKPSKAAGANFFCYRVTDLMTLHFATSREEALAIQKQLQADGQDAQMQRLTVRSNEDLARLLREHTV